jgi:hypothetical protein
MSPLSASFKAINQCIVILLALLTCLSLPTLSLAKDFRDLYPLKTLQHVQTVYGENIRGVLFEDIYPYLLPNERRSLSTVKLEVPLYGSNASIFDFYMGLQSGVMTIPALSIKFFDDMSLAFAWYEYKKKDKVKIIEYVARLYAQKDYLQAPLPALGVPEKAWQQSDYVDDVSQKFLKSGIAFLLLHELGHWHYQHVPYDVISHKQAQEQEKQSDSMALDVMGRMHTIPFGMVIWFTVTGLLQGDPTTHPLSADRLYAIAETIEKNPAVFIARENAEIYSEKDILSVASNIRIIANEMKSIRQ